MKHTIFKPLLAAAAVLTALNGFGSIVMLDFGPNAPAGNETLSPAHAEGAATGADTTWNVLATSAPASGTVSALLDSLNNPTSVSVTYGSNTGGKIIDYTASIASVHSGSSAGIFAGIGDMIFNGGSSSSDYSIGLRFDGLAAGDYNLFIVSRNMATGSGQTMSIFTATGASSTSFDFGSLTAAADIVSTGNTEAWLLNESYGKISVSVAAGESVFLAVDGTAGQNRGFLSAVQIASVPEPATTAILVGLVAVAFAAIRRRRS